MYFRIYLRILIHNRPVHRPPTNYIPYVLFDTPEYSLAHKQLRLTSDFLFVQQGFFVGKSFVDDLGMIGSYI